MDKAKDLAKQYVGDKVGSVADTLKKVGKAADTAGTFL